MSRILAGTRSEDVSQVPRTLLDRVAQWWRTSTLTLWAMAGAATLFQLMVLNVASYTYPHLPLRGWVIASLLLAGSLLARRHWPLAVVTATSLGSAAVDLWGPRGGLNLLSMLALYALLVTASTRDRLIGFGICALCTLVPTTLAKWPQVSMLSPDFLTLVLVLAVASISRSRRQALEHGDAQLAAQSAEQRLVAQRDAARHQARVAAELHDSVGHALTAIIALSEGMQGVSGSPQTDEAIDMMNVLARDGLADTRRAVASLQAEPGPSPNDTAGAPTVQVAERQQALGGAPGWDRLPDLLTTVRATGISAALTETGRRPLGTAGSQNLGEVVYVVVREALTNVMRHGEGTTRVVISLDHNQTSTRITVSDDGRGAPGSSQAPAAAGHGLANLAATVGEHGGTLSAGPTADEGASGWVLHALVPLPEGTPR
ncbi:sensor histidine kinase [Actinomyces naeslundii]|uniref:histidine kinase n=1 Tax=Actinomyces naeslundii TaxID=1655 RepID=A0AA47FIE2_ACTNA|nr:histidine kinase [Actinomyces naeslundii]OMG16088.1 two-component sensor histidine kinase [Actinomyces naeslundii]PKY94117.1 two-component sensor histidine kinase [Actinomyces naeslundii]WAL42901.1 histidine kinase [Actinomyces naeslundii]